MTLDPIAEATAAQRRAADPMISVWVGASAGTGKTRVLTDRVLRLLLAGALPHRLLCLTFTKAAAAEMANRITVRLQHWAACSSVTLVAELSHLLGTPPDDADVIAARRLFARVLDAPGGLAIQTIHGFAQTLLGRFPIEAGLAPGFQVLDEAEATTLLKQAVDGALDATAPHHAALAHLINRLAEQSFRDLIRSVMKDRGRLLAALPDGGGGTRAAWADRLATWLGIPDDRDGARALGQLFTPEHRARQLWAAGLLATTGKSSDAASAAALHAALAAGSDRAAWQAYRGAFLTEKNEPYNSFATKALATKHPDLLQWAAGETTRVLFTLEHLRAVEIYAGSLALVEVAHAVHGRYEALKAARLALDYDDLILAARRVLESDGGASWVLYKLDGGIDHILIDEAQDTNPDQWAIVRQLVAEIAATAARDRPTRTLFVVGDAKQSIYSFQRADLAVFEDMRRHFAASLGVAEVSGSPRWREVDLAVSFRSGDAVLDLVDAIFANNRTPGVPTPPVAPPSASGEGAEGTPRLHVVSRIGAAGSVELWPLVTSAAASALPLWQPPAVAAEEAAPKQRLAKALALKIAAMIGTEVLDSQGRPIQAGDILVLVRSRQDLVDLLVRALKENDVPVAGSDRMVIADQLPVQDVMAVIRVALLPEDDLTLAALLRSPLIDLSEAALFALAHARPRGTALIDALMARAAEPAFERAAARIAQWRADADRMPPYEFLSLVLGRDRGRALLASRLGASALDPVDELLSEALRFEASEPPTLQGFVRWIEGSGRDIKRENDAVIRNEVRIMTVHGAKGLQAPVVVLADAAGDPTAARTRQTLFWDQGLGPIWSPSSGSADPRTRSLHAAATARRLEEHNRLLYVALTRAEDRLIIAGVAPGKGRSLEHSWWQRVADAMAELGAETVADGAPGLPGDVLRIMRAQRVPVAPQAATGDATPLPTLPTFALTPPPPEPARPKPLRPSEPLSVPGRASPLRTGPDRLSALKRGRLIHTLLQVLPTLPPAERPHAAARLLAQPLHALDFSTQTDLQREVLAVLADPQFEAIFAPDSHAEVPIVGRVGRHTVAGRIDRLAVCADRVLLVDIKTDRPPPATVEATAPGHLGQLALYHALLCDLYPDRPVEAALLWTDGPRLMPVPSSVLQRHVPE